MKRSHAQETYLPSSEASQNEAHLQNQDALRDGESEDKEEEGHVMEHEQPGNRIQTAG